MTAHTIKAVREQFRAQGKFHTPPELAKFLHDLIPDADNVRDVYDPTCGAGSLLAQFPDSTPKCGQDIDKTALHDANQLPNFTGAHGDVLAQPAFDDKRFHAIVANPPFSVKWEANEHIMWFGAPTIPTASKADFAFIVHIIHQLADDGTAAVLCFPGIGYRGGREQQLRQWITENRWLKEVHFVPGNQFTDTAISTIALVLTKTTNDTVRMVDTEHGIERNVPVSEIEEHDWSWTPSAYVQPEPVEKEKADPAQLQEEAVSHLLKNLRAGLEMQKFVCQLEGWDFEPIRTRALNTVQSI
ncbi:N-6 DNA methylase [Rothia terrae]|uniref:N-6 DNA methylase n=1 Tax=Rothia terrae TaxID=396015 RepID=UPI0037FDDAA8